MATTLVLLRPFSSSVRVVYIGKQTRGWEGDPGVGDEREKTTDRTEHKNVLCYVSES